MANITSYESYPDFLNNFVVYVDARQYNRICRRRIQRDRLLLRKGRPKAVYVPIAIRDPNEHRNTMHIDNNRLQLPLYYHQPQPTTMYKRFDSSRYSYPPNPHMDMVNMTSMMGGPIPMSGSMATPIGGHLSSLGMPPTLGLTQQSSMGSGLHTPMGVNLNNTALIGTTPPLSTLSSSTNTSITHYGSHTQPSLIPLSSDDKGMANFADVATLISTDKEVCNYSNSVTSGSTHSRNSEYSPESHGSGNFEGMAPASPKVASGFNNRLNSYYGEFIYNNLYNGTEDTNNNIGFCG